jgi:hypothetical protein
MLGREPPSSVCSLSHGIYLSAEVMQPGGEVEDKRLHIRKR